MTDSNQKLLYIAQISYYEEAMKLLKEYQKSIENIDRLKEFLLPRISKEQVENFKKMDLNQLKTAAEAAEAEAEAKAEVEVKSDGLLRKPSKKMIRRSRKKSSRRK
jgi:hypothetical protein